MNDGRNGAPAPTEYTAADQRNAERENPGATEREHPANEGRGAGDGPEAAAGAETAAAGTIAEAMRTLQRQLIDSGKRTRLTNTPLGKDSAKTLAVKNGSADDIFSTVWTNKKKMRFVPQTAQNAAGNGKAEEETEDGPDAAQETAANLPFEGDTVLNKPKDAGPEDAATDEENQQRRQERAAERKLHTKLYPEKLKNRLLTLDREARTIEEEQGVNVLFLAMGFLRWYENENSEVERFAPLILLPVDLKRDDIRDSFKLIRRDQDMETNLPLQELLQQDFGIKLPELPDDEDWLPSEYFDRVRRATSSQRRWEVLPGAIELSFYSFAKLLMWKDLKAAEAEGGKLSELCRRLLVSGFEAQRPVFDADAKLDEAFADPRDLGHVMDADKSQTEAIAGARAGRSMVVQGPPGTGKSQTIANIIAGAVRDGKRVLFVAEKRVALDVVHTRLEKCGLGPACLELHSHKTKRAEFYEELRRTLHQGEPKQVEARHYEALRAVRDSLNSTSALLHRRDLRTGETAYLVMGRLSKLKGDGVPVPDFRIPGCDEWSASEHEELLKATTRLAELTAEHGSEREHAWRGATRRLSPMDRERFAARQPEAAEKLERLQAAAERAADAVGTADGSRLSAATAAAESLSAVEGMPAGVLRLLESDALAEQPAKTLALCLDGEVVRELKAELAAEVVEDAFGMEWGGVRLEIAGAGRSLLRWFNGAYRRAARALRSIQRDGGKRPYQARLDLLDRLIDYRKRKTALAAKSGLAKQSLGPAWNEEDTDFEAIVPSLQWIAAQAGNAGSGAAVRRLARAATICDIDEIQADLRRAAEEWNGIWDAVRTAAGLDIQTAFGAERIEDIEWNALKTRLQAWASDAGGIEDWHALRSAAERAAELGLAEIRERLADGRLKAADARGTLEYIRAEAVWRRLVREQPGLEWLDGRDRTEKVAEFRRLDERLQTLAAQEAALKHFEGLPSGAAGMMGIVRGEIAKKTRRMRVRKLLGAAGGAVQKIKPVFLMSPMSVAQYLPRGKMEFDLLVVDEASQVRPADAMGSILRSNQIVVVGDGKQLPPTTFFDRQVAADEEAEAEGEPEDIVGAQVGDMESILTLCEARGLPTARLRWHYRSQHPSLIAVSNREFYDDELICPPSPHEPGPSIGFRFTPVEGEYGRGRKRDNPKEAEAVADAVLAHALARGGETLGVVALSVPQRNAILNKLEEMRREHPELEAFCKEGKDDPFFVKNLENVQGDERDVIFVSIGYGKDAGGYMAQSFGPVSNAGGERRLNVLFTRAKRQCRVFSSIRHTDIRLDATKHAGPRVLKQFLQYAETGEMDVPVITGGPPDSPFEEDVAHELERHGHRVEGQIGSGGFKIDLAVRDPADESRFLLAVECDGARYHSSSWARERDRMRQAVLEDKGWTFHRIWSTDWFTRREEEIQKLLEAVERAGSDNAADRRPAPATARRETVERHDRRLDLPAESPAYREADFEVHERRSMHLYEAPASAVEPYIAKIVEEEGPVHVDEVVRRLSKLWGYGRRGKRIEDAVKWAVRTAAHRKLIRYCPRGDGQFLVPAGEDKPPTIRNRAGADPQLRKKEMLPPSEIEAAVLSIVEGSVGISIEECAVQAARMLGCKPNPPLRKHLEQQIGQTLTREKLMNHEGHLQVPEERRELRNNGR